MKIFLQRYSSCLRVLHIYFNGSTKLFSDLYLKFYFFPFFPRKINVVEYASDAIEENLRIYNILLSKRQSIYAIDANVHKILCADVYVVIHLWAQYRGGAIRDEWRKQEERNEEIGKGG